MVSSKWVPESRKLTAREGTHRGVARGVGQEGCLPEERSGLKRRSLFFLRHDLHPTTPQQIAFLAILALPDDGSVCGDRFVRDEQSACAGAPRLAWRRDSLASRTSLLEGSGQPRKSSSAPPGWRPAPGETPARPGSVRVGARRISPWPGACRRARAARSRRLPGPSIAGQSTALPGRCDLGAALSDQVEPVTRFPLGYHCGAGGVASLLEQLGQLLERRSSRRAKAGTSSSSSNRRSAGTPPSASSALAATILIYSPRPVANGVIEHCYALGLRDY